MILVLENTATLSDVKQLTERLERMGFRVVCNHDHDRYTLAIIGGVDDQTKQDLFAQLPLVKTVLPLTHKFKLAGREIKQQPTVITIGDKKIGANDLAVMAGPCSVESQEQMLLVAATLSQYGATIMRGGAFKPRTSPYEFQGLGEKGLQYMRHAADKYGLLIVSEIMDPADAEMMLDYVDIFQVGARNMQNYTLLKKVGKVNKPVLLKRGMCATYNEFLLAAEYILNEGNPNVMLCERGIRTFETYCRNTLDITAVPVLKELSHLPVIVDPSHGTGVRSMVTPMARAAVAAGADGVLVEMHPDPDKSWSDAKQTISFDMFAELMRQVKLIKEVVNSDITVAVGET
jgi:3-deoxy-7-phosphoheptulonate synthase